MRYLIVGIDPGTTTAFAAVDLDGKIVSMQRSKSYSEKTLLEELRKLGKPIIISTDKEKVPRFVRKIASRLSAKLFSPDHDLGVKEKKELVSDQKIIGHRRDALAAAIFVYKVYEDLFRRIDSSVSKNKRDEVKKKILLDEAINIKDALREKPKEVKESKKRRTRVGEQEVSTLRKSNFLLKKKVRELEGKLKHVEERYSKTSRSGRGLMRSEVNNLAENRLRTIREMSKEINRLKNDLVLLEKRNRILSSGGVPLGDDVIVSGRKVVVGKGGKKDTMYINKENFDVLEMDGLEYVPIQEIEKKIAQKIVDGLISDYRKKH